jgi:hypothetical protein
MKRFLIALLLLTTTAWASAPDHQAWVSAAAHSLPVYFEDKAPELADAKAQQLDQVATVVARVSMTAPRSPREWSALLLTIGFRESTFSLRVHRGECNLLKHECDAHTVKGIGLVARAKSPWQLHENDFTRPVWDQLTGVENTEAQVMAADAALRRGYWTCARSGAPWLQGTINGFAGKACSSRWPGLVAREATFNRLMATPAARASAGYPR